MQRMQWEKEEQQARSDLGQMCTVACASIFQYVQLIDACYYMVVPACLHEFARALVQCVCCSWTLKTDITAAGEAYSVLNQAHKNHRSGVSNYVAARSDLMH